MRDVQIRQKVAERGILLPLDRGDAGGPERSFFDSTERDDAGGGRNLRVRRVLTHEDHVGGADAVDTPVDGYVGAGGAAGVNELGLADEVADLRDPSEALWGR